jgi:hypothetical protein
MSESEETKWRLGVKPEESEEGAARLPSEEDEEKLQQTIQAKAEEIGGGEGEEGSLVTGLVEEEPITEPPKKKERKAKGLFLKKREPDSNKSMANISRQVKRQANQLIKIEKAIVSLQKPISKIDKQSNIIKQLYGAVTQLQRQVRSSKNPKIKQVSQKKKVSKKESH